MKKILLVIFVLLHGFLLRAQNVDDYIEWHVDDWGVYIDTFSIQGPVYPTDSIFILVGSEGNEGDLKIAKDLAQVDYDKSGLEGFVWFDNENNYFSDLLIFELKNKKNVINNIIIIIKRDEQIIKEISKPLSTITGWNNISNVCTVSIHKIGDENIELINHSNADIIYSCFSFIGEVISEDIILRPLETQDINRNTNIIVVTDVNKTSVIETFKVL